MFIKTIKTKNKKTGIEYIKHCLVESIRTEKGPRHRTVMQLGRLTLDKKYWSQLISELSVLISGQGMLKIPGATASTSIKVLASSLFENFKIEKEQRVERRKDVEPEKITINIETLSTTKSRSYGAELVAHSVWNKLKLSKKLKELNFTPKERSLAEAVTVGRLINPGSELDTWDWLQNRSAIGDLTESALDKTSLTSFYKIGDKLLEHKQELEEHLYDKEMLLHPNRESVYLFDLTNFYFEGQALGNTIAKYGKSKEKRYDCPLVSLGLVVDSSGFPITSEVFSGNIGEPKTLTDILDKMGYFKDYLPNMLPTLIMDRGIATKENIELLKTNQISYVLITRGPRNATYLKEFENYKNDSEFKTITRNKKAIRIKEVVSTDSESREILCISEGKKEKESAMRRRWTERASFDIVKLQKSIKKGTIKNIEKINKKIGRLEERYANLNKYFNIELVADKSNNEIAIELNFNEKPVFDIEKDMNDPLAGTYVIETTLQEKNAEDIWSLYMTLTRVEEAFKCMKSDLGTRPIFHHTAKRTQAHLFISVLAYHLLINIEYKMTQGDDNRRWSTIRKILQTHQRSTIILLDEKKRIHHVRLTGQPEACHLKIYNILKVNIKKGLKKYIIAKRL